MHWHKYLPKEQKSTPEGKLPKGLPRRMHLTQSCMRYEFCKNRHWNKKVTSWSLILTGVRFLSNRPLKISRWIWMAYFHHIYGRDWWSHHYIVAEIMRCPDYSIFHILEKEEEGWVSRIVLMCWFVRIYYDCRHTAPRALYVMQTMSKNPISKMVAGESFRRLGRMCKKEKIKEAIVSQ